MRQSRACGSQTPVQSKPPGSTERTAQSSVIAVTRFMNLPSSRQPPAEPPTRAVLRPPCRLTAMATHNQVVNEAPCWLGKN